MPVPFEEASLTLVLAGETHSSADLALLLEDMQMLVSASVWASLADEAQRDETTAIARRVILDSLQRPATGSRFYPGFSDALRQPGALPFERAGQSGVESGFRAPPSDAEEPLDMAALVGVNSWLQRQLRSASPELYRKVFAFASIRKAEHNSPLLLEMGIVLGAAVAVPVVLTYGLMRAAARAKRQNIEVGIREVELAAKRVALRQREVQLMIQEEIADAFKQQRLKNPDFQVPESVLASAAAFAEPAVAELGSSPLIEKVSFSASIGGKS